MGICVILVMFACCCLLSACCLRLVWKRPHEKSLEPRSGPGMQPSVSADDVRAVDAALRARRNSMRAADCQKSACFPSAEDCVEASYPALDGVKSQLTQPNECWLDLTQLPVVPGMPELRQSFEWRSHVGNLAEPVESSDLSANRLENDEKDHSNSDPARPEPPRETESERIENPSSRASNILYALRSSFGRVRV